MTAQEASDTIALAERLGLSGASFLDTLGPEKVAAACNGAGPERVSARCRRLLSWWFRIFKPCFDVHDCRFTYLNDGTRTLFDAANAELGLNCRKVADSRYRWFNPLRYIARFCGTVIEGTCREFGWGPWQEAYQKAKNAQKPG